MLHFIESKKTDCLKPTFLNPLCILAARKIKAKTRKTPEAHFACQNPLPQELQRLLQFYRYHPKKACYKLAGKLFTDTRVYGNCGQRLSVASSRGSRRSQCFNSCSMSDPIGGRFFQYSCKGGIFATNWSHYESLANPPNHFMRFCAALRSTLRLPSFGHLGCTSC